MRRVRTGRCLLHVHIRSAPSTASPSDRATPRRGCATGATGGFVSRSGGPSSSEACLVPCAGCGATSTGRHVSARPLRTDGAWKRVRQESSPSRTQLPKLRWTMNAGTPSRGLIRVARESLDEVIERVEAFRAPPALSMFVRASSWVREGNVPAVRAGKRENPLFGTLQARR